MNRMAWKIICLLCLACSVKALDIAEFQLDGEYTTSTWLQAKSTIDNELDDLSVCFWLSLAHLRGTYNFFISYADDSTDNALTAQLLLKTEVIELEVCKYRATQECSRFPLKDLQFMDWMHFCTTFQVTKGSSEVTTEIKSYWDGQLVQEDRVTNPKDAYKSLMSDGVLVLGQDQDMVGGNFDASQAFSGKMTGFSIWDEVISESDIEDLAKCRESAAGNVFDWDMDNYDNSEVIILDGESIEYPYPLKDKFIVTERTAYEGFKAYCDRLSGQMPIPKDLNEMEEIHDKMSEALALLEDAEICSVTDEDRMFYMGQRMNTDRKWVNPYTGQIIESDSPLHTYQPFEDSDQCVYVWGGKKFEAMACNSKFACGVCSIPEGQRLKLKGLCKESVEVEYEYDIDYYVYGQVNGKPHFRGIMNSHIYYDPGMHRYKLQSFRKPEKFLYISTKNPNVLPLGTHHWALGTDSAMCMGDKGEKVDLTLSICFYNKYTCNSGDCIPLSNRCNTEIDCDDKSDEYECDYLSFGPNYAKELVPRDEKGETLIVHMNVSILAFPFIETVNLKFTADFFLSLRWYDLRIDFRDLNNVTFLNSLSGDDRERIWVPRLGFVNALGPYQTEVDDLTTGVLIREDDPLPEDMSLGGHEAMLFSGRTNSILLRREYYQEYACDFDLLYYPFDTQMCRMVFQVQGKTDNYVKIVKDYDGIEFLGGRELVEYEIQLEKFETRSINNISTAIVKIVFRRRMEYHVTNTFLQTLILVGIGYMSYYFAENNFSDRIMVVLTTMLVIATIMSSTQQSLPKTSYYKLIDWWLLVCLNILVITMSFHTYIAKVCIHRPREDGETKESMLNALKNRFRTSVGTRSRASVGTAKTREGDVLSNLRYHDPTSEVQAARPENVANGGANNYDSLDSSDFPNKIPKYKDPVLVNTLGKWVYIIILILFNVIFWTVALLEFFKDAKEYINKDLEEDN